MLYNVNFIGRRIGSIGTTFPIQQLIEADSEDAARAILYEMYEHCTKIVYTLIEDRGDIPKFEERQTVKIVGHGRVYTPQGASTGSTGSITIEADYNQLLLYIHNRRLQRGDESLLMVEVGNTPAIPVKL
jgi:hypothetical protein